MLLQAQDSDFIVSQCFPESGVEFIFSELALNFNGATRRCAEVNSAPVSLTNELKFNQLLQFINISDVIGTNAPYLGLRKSEEDINSTDPTTFTWTDGTQITSNGFASVAGEFPWGRNRPDSDGEQRCTALQINLKFNDASCTSFRPMFCERACLIIDEDEDETLESEMTMIIYLIGLITFTFGFISSCLCLLVKKSTLREIISKQLFLQGFQ